MSKTQIKDALRNIRKRIVSFLSLCLVVTLGLGALFTTRYMGAGLDREISGYFSDRDLKDYEMISSLGVSDANIDKISKVEKVTAVEGVIAADGSISFNGKKSSVTVISLTKEVSVPEVTEGSLPEGKSECMIGEDFAAKERLKVGDEININMTGMDTEEGDSPLYSKKFTITGLMHHPDYFRRRSTNTVVLPLTAFDKDVTQGIYTRAFIRIDEPEGVSIFDDKFFEETADTKAALVALEEELSRDRTQEVKDEAYALIDEEWEKAELELADAQNQIDAGQAELNSRLKDGRNKLNSAQNKLNKTIARYRKEINDGKKELRKYKEMLAQVEEYLPQIKEYVKQTKEGFEGDLEETLKQLAKIEDMLDKLDKITDKDSPEYKEAVTALAKFISNNADTIRKVHAFFNNSKVMDAAKKIRDITDGAVDGTKIISRMANFDVETMISLANMIVEGDTERVNEFVQSLRDYADSLRDSIRQYEEYENKIAEYEANREEINKKLADKDKELKAAEKKLAEEQKKYQKQIDAGWSRYYAEKARYESKLEEAKLLLAENREEAERKLAEARAEVENIEPCRWITLDRMTNAGYVDAKSNLAAINRAGNVFGLLFMIVTAIVCLSTLAIIIDEQKKLVGTVKAFGFRKGEVLGKYLIFGASAAIAGSLLAAGSAYILAEIVQAKYAGSGMYQVGTARSIFTPGITLAAALLITAVTIAASVIACSGILRSPASMLMKGTVLKKKKARKKESYGKGSLYSRLILRNMSEDKSRVFVTIAIIAFSCMLIGMGISMKLAYDGMISRQIADVNRYDFRLDMSDDVSEKEEAALVKVLEKNNTAFLASYTDSMLYKWNDRIDGLQLICADPASLQEFYAVSDPKTGEPLEIPADGVLIQKRMNESYGISEGDELSILDTELVQHNAEVRGYFTNYVGRTVVVSPEAYSKIFGKKCKINSYYVKANGADIDAVKDELVAVSDNIKFSDKDEFKSTFASVAALYNIIVLLITGIAILISFMILTNLSNIFLNRRKTELSVMRVNGFSIRQAKGYLSRESIITTATGLVLGVLLGAGLTPPIISMLQQPDLEFVKSFHPVAWIIAVALEAAFAIIINIFVFRKVAKLNLRDIA